MNDFCKYTGLILVVVIPSLIWAWLMDGLIYGFVFGLCEVWIMAILAAWPESHAAKNDRFRREESRRLAAIHSKADSNDPTRCSCPDCEKWRASVLSGGPIYNNGSPESSLMARQKTIDRILQFHPTEQVV